MRSFCLIILCCAIPAFAQDAGAAVDAGLAENTLVFSLYDDYRCPPAPPCERSDAGTWICSDARISRENCGLAGANVEVHSWRDREMARASSGFQLLPSHGVLALIGAVLTAEIAVIKSRASQGCRAVANPFASTCH
jgi:hypothetical protein